MENQVFKSCQYADTSPSVTHLLVYFGLHFSLTCSDEDIGSYRRSHLSTTLSLMESKWPSYTMQDLHTIFTISYQIFCLLKHVVSFDVAVSICTENWMKKKSRVGNCSYFQPFKYLAVLMHTVGNVSFYLWPVIFYLIFFPIRALTRVEPVRRKNWE